MLTQGQTLLYVGVYDAGMTTDKGLVLEGYQ